MRFYMIDRVVSYEPWKSIHAQKLTSRNEIAGWAEVVMGPKAGVNPPTPTNSEGGCKKEKKRGQSFLLKKPEQERKSS
jgi:hypothetical protein